MLRDHSFRKANIAVGIAATAMAIGRIAFGRDASDIEVQLVTIASFAIMIVAVFAQYELEYRRERRSDGDDRSG
jgi:hypothetical protein